MKNQKKAFITPQPASGHFPSSMEVKVRTGNQSCDNLHTLSCFINQYQKKKKIIHNLNTVIKCIIKLVVTYDKQSP